MKIKNQLLLLFLLPLFNSQATQNPNHISGPSNQIFRPRPKKFEKRFMSNTNNKKPITHSLEQRALPFWFRPGFQPKNNQNRKIGDSRIRDRLRKALLLQNLRPSRIANGGFFWNRKVLPGNPKPDSSGRADFVRQYWHLFGWVPTRGKPRDSKYSHESEDFGGGGG